VRKITLLPFTGRHWLQVLLVVSAAILPIGGAKATQPMNFDIPSLPLSQALARYGEASGFAVLVDSDLTAGRRSSAIQGRFDPYAALRYLLRDTGLVARYAGANAFTVVAAPADVQRERGAAGGGDVSTPGLGGYRFGALLQQALLQTLCKTPQTRPGNYRAVIQLWLNGQGTVERVRLIDSTGLLKRDNAILKQIKGLRLAEGTPMRLPQPLTILVLPGEGTAKACRTHDA
jgi:hypothetical protein